MRVVRCSAVGCDVVVLFCCLGVVLTFGFVALLFRCLLRGVCCLLLVVWCLLFVVGCSLIAVCCVLIVG